MEEKTTYTVAETAKALSVSTKTIYNYLYSGKIEAVKIGSKWIIKADTVKKILKNGIK